jgi:hypothetical protein
MQKVNWRLCSLPIEAGAWGLSISERTPGRALPKNRKAGAIAGKNNLVTLIDRAGTARAQLQQQREILNRKVQIMKIEYLCIVSCLVLAAGCQPPDEDNLPQVQRDSEVNAPPSVPAITNQATNALPRTDQSQPYPPR